MTDDRQHDVGGDDDVADFTAEELMEQAQINAQALFLGTAAALAHDAPRLASWRNHLAATFAKGWDTEAEWDAPDILYALLTNYRSYGAMVVEADLEAEHPLAVITNLPNEFLAEQLEIDYLLMHNLFRIGEDLAQHLGGTLSWRETEEGMVELRVTVP